MNKLDKFEKIAKKIIKKKFPSWKFIEPTHKNFDLKFRDSKTGRNKFVEVKGRSKPFSNASLEATCYDMMKKHKEDYYIILLTPENNKVTYTILQFKDFKQIRSTKDKSRPSVMRKRAYQIYFKLDSSINVSSLHITENVANSLRHY